MLLARAATKEEKEKKDGGVAAGPPKKKKQRVMTDADVDRFVDNYLTERADTNGMLQPRPPCEPPPYHILKANRFATGQ